VAERLPAHVEHWRDTGLLFCPCCGWTWPDFLIDTTAHCPYCQGAGRTTERRPTFSVKVMSVTE